MHEVSFMHGAPSFAKANYWAFAIYIAFWFQRFEIAYKEKERKKEYESE